MLKIVSFDFSTPLMGALKPLDFSYHPAFASYLRITAKMGVFSKIFGDKIFVFANTPRIIECVEAIKK